MDETRNRYLQDSGPLNVRIYTIRGRALPILRAHIFEFAFFPLEFRAHNLEDEMSSLRMNASKAEARRLAGCEGPENDERWNKSELCCLSSCPHGLIKTCNSIIRLTFTSFKLPLTLRSPGGTWIHLKRRVLYLRWGISVRRTT